MKRQSFSGDLTQGPIASTLMLFFLPIAAGNLFQQFYNTADALIISKFVGTGALAAVGGSSAQVINVMMGFFTALSGGSGVVIAQAYGSGDEERIRRASGTAIVLSVVLGLIFTGIGMVFCPAILAAMQTPADTMADSILYLRICFSAIVCNTIYNMGAAILRAAGDSRRPLIVLVVCCLTNIALDILLVTVVRMGVAGVALATILSQFISAVIILVFLCRTREAYRISLRTMRPDGSSLKRMLQIGIPSGMQSSMYTLSNLIIQVALNPLGTIVVASWSMTGKIDGVFWSVSGALGTAIMSFVGQNYGALRHDRIRKCAKTGMVISLTSTFVLVAAILLFAEYGMHLLTDDVDVMIVTREMLWCFVPYYFLWTVIEVLSSTLRGIGDTLRPVLITAGGICGFRIFWVLVIFPVFPTAAGISYCYPVSWALTAAILAAYYYQRRRNGMLQTQNA